MDARKLVTLTPYDLHIADCYAGARTGTSRQLNFNADTGYVPASPGEGPTERDRRSWRGMVAMARAIGFAPQPEADVESWATVNNQNTAPDVPAPGRRFDIKVRVVEQEKHRLLIRTREHSDYQPTWIFVSALVSGASVDLRGWASQEQIKASRLQRVGYSGSGEEEQAWFMTAAELNPMWMIL